MLRDHRNKFPKHEDFDIEREKAVNEKLKAYFAQEKPIDIMFAAKESYTGEDYRYYDSTGRHR